MNSVSVSHGQDNSLQVGVQGAISIQPSLAASLAVPVLDVTILVAGSSLGLDVDSSLVGSGQDNGLQVGVQGAISIQPSVAALGAVPVLDVTILVAGSSLGLDVHDGVILEGLNRHHVQGHAGTVGIVPAGAAVGAVPVLDVAHAAAGGLNSLNVQDVVSSLGVGQLAAQHAESVTGIEVLVLAPGLNRQIVGQNVLAVSLSPVHVVNLASLELDVGGLTVVAVVVVLAGKQQASGIGGNLDGVDNVASLGDGVLLGSNTGPLGVGDGAAPPVGGQILEHPVVLVVNSDHLDDQAADGAGAINDVVAQSRNLFLSNDGSATVSTDGASGLASGGAGSILSGQIVHVGVSAVSAVGSGQHAVLQGEGDLGLLSQGQLGIAVRVAGIGIANSVGPIRPSSLILVITSRYSQSDGPGAVSILGHAVGIIAGVPIVVQATQVVVSVLLNGTTKGGPGAATPTADNIKHIVIRGDAQVTGLVPLSTPIQSIELAGIHTAENNLGVTALGNDDLIGAIVVRVGHLNPSIAAITEEVSSEPGAGLQPITAGGHVQSGASGIRSKNSGNHGQHHCETNQHSDQSLASFEHSFSSLKFCGFTGIKPWLL